MSVESPEVRRPVGLGGGMIAVFLGLGLALLRSIKNIFSFTETIYAPPAKWTLVAFDAYILVTQCALALAAIYCAILAYKYDKYFPPFHKYFWLLYFLVSLSIPLIIYPALDFVVEAGHWLRPIVCAALGGILVSYVALSDRVRNTFYEQNAGQ